MQGELTSTMDTRVLDDLYVVLSLADSFAAILEGIQISKHKYKFQASTFLMIVEEEEDNLLGVCY